jgi:glycyl-tRNA synthetase
MAQGSGLFQKVVNLCKRRGFIHQSAELVGGLKGCYDYGPLGVELKRNIANEWYGANTMNGNGLEGKARQAKGARRVLPTRTTGHVCGTVPLLHT